MCQLGDLIGDGPEPDYKQAMQHHLEAIKLAAPLTIDRRFAVRRTAKRVLVEAHLAVGRDIAAGNWQRKTEVVPKWLDRAKALADELIQNDDGDRALHLLVYRKSLAAYAGAGGLFDPSQTARAAVTEARRLDAAASDPLYKRQLVWELGTALLDSLRVEHRRGTFQPALRHGKLAVALLEGSVPHRQASAKQNLLFGELYFLIGSIHAVHKKDHVTAIMWYDKGLSHLSESLPISALGNVGRVGEWLVSMGVSNWEIGAKDKAVKLTERGVKLVEQAVQNNTIERTALTIPYGNLARMNHVLGNEAEADNYREMAAQIDEGENGTKQR